MLAAAQQCGQLIAFGLAQFYPVKRADQPARR
jgi:hypothetical protein